MNGQHPQNDMSEALRQAVERGHIDRVVDLLKRGAPSVLDQEGQTPLHIAASAGHIQLVDALIQAGCDVTVQDFVSDFEYFCPLICQLMFLLISNLKTAYFDIFCHVIRKGNSTI